MGVFMKIFGIDQSYTCTGLIVLENDNVLHAEKFVTDATKDKPARAWNVAQRIGQLVEEHEPDIIALEGLAFGMRGDATRDLAGLQFVIVCILREIHKRECIIVSPRTVKKVATGSGKADKMEMYELLPQKIKNLFEEMGLKKTTGMLDLTDAYYIAKVVSDPKFKSEGLSKPKKKKKKRNKKKVK